MYKLIILFLLLNSFSLYVKGQTYFDVSKEYPCQSCASYLADINNMARYSEKTINDIFDSIIKSEIQFNYPQGGCQNRAQIMSMVLLKKFEIQHCKIWLFSPNDLNETDYRQLEIDDKNLLSTENIIKWNYHVAPCVLILKRGKLDTLVIDPALDKFKPMKLSDWFHGMKNSHESKFTFLNPEWYFFYTKNNKVITGEFYKFEEDNHYCADNFRNLTLEKSLAINDLAIYILNKYLIKLRNSVNQDDIIKYSELKKVFGNVDVLTEFFGNLKSYCGAMVVDNISLKQIQGNYNDVMSDAMLYFIQRLNYWTITVKQLST